MIANRTELADIFGVAKTTVDAWVHDGCPVLEKPGKGIPSKYDTAEVYQWLKTKQGESGKFADLLDEERHRKLKRENDLEEGLVAPISVITEVLAKSCGQISATLSALPLTLKKQCPALASRDIDHIKKEIAKCRNIAAKAAVDAVRE